MKNYKYTLLLIATLLALFYIIDFPVVRVIIATIGTLGYVGAVFAGFFFVSSFTVVPATILLYNLSITHAPIEVALFAGLGAVLGDYLIFRFFRDLVFEELRPPFLRFGGSKLIGLLHKPYFSWLLPILGAVIIASPFPDEIGIGLLGASSLKNWQFLVLSFLLNALGILTLLLVL